MSSWYIAVDGKAQGPLSAQEIRQKIASGELPQDILVWREGMDEWAPATSQVELQGGQMEMSLGPFPSPPPGAGAGSAGQRAHEIDYEIFGHEMQFVEIELDPGESAVAEAGAMMYMTEGIEMQTIFGDGSEGQGGSFFDKLVGAGKRLITGESLFCTVFTHTGHGKGKVAFSAPYPGKIIPLDLKDYDGEVICQKDAFLCCAKGVSIDIAFQKKIGVGLFGGEGFIMQRLKGDGLAFVHAGGTIVERQLEAGETLKVDTGCIVALTKGVDYDIEFVGNVTSALFGGEGFFFARLRGPGHVWLQSLPFSRLAGRMLESAPTSAGGGGRDAGEGSILGGLGNLFESR
jgi:uncharacterized protein (TIGR00266 family)